MHRVAMEIALLDTMELLDVRQRPITADEYHEMARAGILHEDERIELIDGRLIAMSPIGWPHANIVTALNELLVRLTTHQVSVQNPVRLDRFNEPQPDIVLLRRDRDPAGPMLAEHAALVVEVADSTLAFDRRVKLARYALAGIREVWIVNVEAMQLEIYRHPSGDTYEEKIVLRPGDEARVPGGGSIAVRDVFPGG